MCFKALKKTHWPSKWNFGFLNFSCKWMQYFMQAEFQCSAHYWSFQASFLCVGSFFFSIFRVQASYYPCIANRKTLSRPWRFKKLCTLCSHIFVAFLMSQLEMWGGKLSAAVCSSVCQIEDELQGLSGSGWDLRWGFWKRLDSTSQTFYLIITTYDDNLYVTWYLVKKTKNKTIITFTSSCTVLHMLWWKHQRTAFTKKATSCRNKKYSKYRAGKNQEAFLFKCCN